jgi:hypothetical protein
MAMTLDDLRPLLEQFRGDGLMVSCYAGRSAAGPNLVRCGGVAALLPRPEPVGQTPISHLEQGSHA